LPLFAPEFLSMLKPGARPRRGTASPPFRRRRKGRRSPSAASGERSLAADPAANIRWTRLIAGQPVTMLVDTGRDDGGDFRRGRDRWALAPRPGENGRCTPPTVTASPPKRLLPNVDLAGST